MSKRQRNPRSEWLADRPLDKLFSEALDHVARHYYNLERKWKEKEKPVLMKQIREAKRANPNEHQIVLLTKMLKESDLHREWNFLVTTSEFAWVAMDLEDTKQNVRSLTNQLEDLGLVKKQIKDTSDAVQRRERIFARIEELWSGADIRERDYKKLLFYQTR